MSVNYLDQVVVLVKENGLKVRYVLVVVKKDLEEVTIKNEGIVREI